LVGSKDKKVCFGGDTGYEFEDDVTLSAGLGASEARIREPEVQLKRQS
jgi:hypothetical protein